MLLDCRHVSSEASCLICVDVGRSDGRHEADSSLHVITNVPRILDNSTVLMMGINKGAKEAHHHNTILKASQEHSGDQVMQEMTSLWTYCSMSPERNKYVVQQVTLIVMCERVRFSWATNTARMIMLFSVKSLSNAQPITEDA